MELVGWYPAAPAQALTPPITVLHVPVIARHEVGPPVVVTGTMVVVTAADRVHAGLLRRGVVRRGGRHAVAVGRQRDRVGQPVVLAVQVVERAAQPGREEGGQV